MEASEAAKLERVLEVALNPIGSLALRERLDGNRDALTKVFDTVCPRAIVQLILSESGFRIIESFLNANIDDVNVRLADALTKDWSRMKELMELERGRYVYETLLKREMKELANKIIENIQKDWWFSNACALPVLIKAIAISDAKLAMQIIANQQMEADLCDSPEGLYCVLKVKGKSVEEPGWSDSFSRLILLKARSTEGSDALVQAILYGDYLVKEMVEVLFSRRSSFDDCTTVALLIRVIEKSSADLRRLIVKCLCEPFGNPMICQIRNSTQFEGFKRACDAHLTAAQRKRLNDHLAAVPMASLVDECLQKVTTRREEEMDTTRVDGQNNKRRAEPPVTSQSAVKKPREEDAQPSTSKTTVPNAAEYAPPKDTVAPAPVNTVPAPQKDIVPTFSLTTAPSESMDIVPTTSKATVPPPPKIIVPSPSKYSALPVPVNAVPSQPKATVPAVQKDSVHPPSKGTVPQAFKIIVPSPFENTVPSPLNTTVPPPSKDAVPLPSESTVPSAPMATVPSASMATVAALQKDTVLPPSKDAVPSAPMTTVPSASMATVPSEPAFIPLAIPPFIPDQKRRSFPCKKTAFFARPEEETPPTIPPPIPSLISIDTTRSKNTVPSEPSPTIPPFTPSPREKNATPRSKHTVTPADTVADPRIEALRKIGDHERKDVMYKALNSKYHSLIWHLDNETEECAPDTFNGIKNGLLALMMDKRGCEVVKWFLLNGTLDQRGTIENRAFENIEQLVVNGGYGRTIVEIAMEQCANPGKKREFEEKFARAMQSVRDSPSPALVPVGSEIDEEMIEVINLVAPTVKQEEEGAVAEGDQHVSMVEDYVNWKRRHGSFTQPGICVPPEFVRGLAVSQQQSKDIREEFRVLDGRLLYGQRKFCHGEIQQFVSVGKIKDGVAQEFLDLVQERLDKWRNSQGGRSLLKSLFIDKLLRPYMVAPVASNLHLMSDEWGIDMLDRLLCRRLRGPFYYHCFLGDENSPFVKFFRSDVEIEQCVQTGLKIAKADPRKFRDLIYPLRQAIAETEKGRTFIERIADQFEWNELLNTPAPANPACHVPPTDANDLNNGKPNDESTVKQKEEEEDITTALHTVSSSRENIVVEPTTQNATPSIFSAQPNKISFGPNLPNVMTSNQFPISEKQAVTAVQPTVSSSQENTVAAPVEATNTRSASQSASQFSFNKAASNVQVSAATFNFSFGSAPVETKTTGNAAPSIFSVQPSKISFGPKESNGEKSSQSTNAAPPVVNVVKGLPVSRQQSREIREMFTEIDTRLKSEAGKVYDGEIHHLIALGKIKGGGVAQEFIDLVQERMSLDAYRKTAEGRRLLKAVFGDKELLPYLVAPMASNLHLVCDYWGHEILDLLLSYTTYKAFYHHCFLGDENSPFIKFFHSDANKYEIVRTGLKIANVYRDRFRELISPLRRVIADTEKGRRFISRLATVYGWPELREPLPIDAISHAPPTDGATNGTPNGGATVKEEPPEEEEMPETQPAVVAHREDAVAAPDEIARPRLKLAPPVAGIVTGQSVSSDQSMKLREIFTMFDVILRNDREKLSEGDCGKLIAAGKIPGGGVAQEFIDQVHQRLYRWKTKEGTKVLFRIFADAELRPYLVAPVATNLHLVCDIEGGKILTQLLLPHTRDSFYHHCFQGNEESPFVKLFHSDAYFNEAPAIGVKIARANINRFYALIPSLCPSISKTEQGRKFIYTLMRPPPLGFGWTGLLNAAPPIGTASNVIATPQPIVTEPREDTVAAPVETTTPSIDSVQPIKMAFGSRNSNEATSNQDLSVEEHVTSPQFTFTPPQKLAVAAPVETTITQVAIPPIFSTSTPKFSFKSSQVNSVAPVETSIIQNAIPPIFSTSTPKFSLGSSQDNSVAAPVETPTTRRARQSRLSASAPKFSFKCSQENSVAPVETTSSQSAIPSLLSFPFGSSKKNTVAVTVETTTTRSGSQPIFSTSTPKFGSSQDNSVAAPPETKNALSGSQPIATSTPKFAFGSKEFKGFSQPLFGTPLFQSPLITVSSAGVPSFPTTPRSSNFQSDDSTPFYIKLIVRNAVEDMVNKVVRENP